MATARGAAALSKELNQDVLSQHTLMVQSTLEGISLCEPSCHRDQRKKRFACLKKSMILYLALPCTRQARLRNTQAAVAVSSCVRHRWQTSLKVGMQT